MEPRNYAVFVIRETLHHTVWGQQETSSSQVKVYEPDAGLK